MKRSCSRAMVVLFAAAIAVAGAPSRAKQPEAHLTQQGGLISLRFKNTSLHEVFDVLSRHQRVNILLGKGVDGNVSISLYNVDPRQAIHSVASAAGYVVEMRGGDYFIVERKESRLASAGNTQVRSFKVQYSNTKQVGDILTKHLSPAGKITALEERSTLVIEDLPDYLERLQRILREVDAEPKQMLIEAKILEITLDKSEVFGVDWQKIFSADRANAVGTTGLAPRGISGLFFNLVNRNLEIFLAALSSKGRVHTLSTPKLLALENQEASTVIGDRIGYRVTTTINQVTTESIQFLESGVILRVIPSVDQQGRVMLKIRPEVSSATVTGGIPSKKSTEVTTQLLCDDGQSIFIGGLIKQTTTGRRSGVPVLGDVWGIGKLFSNTEESMVMTETVVVITPRIVNRTDTLADMLTERMDATRAEVERQAIEVERKLAPAAPAIAAPVAPEPAPISAPVAPAPAAISARLAPAEPAPAPAPVLAPTKASTAATPELDAVAATATPSAPAIAASAAALPAYPLAKNGRRQLWCRSSCTGAPGENRMRSARAGALPIGGQMP